MTKQFVVSQLFDAGGPIVWGTFIHASARFWNPELLLEWKIAQCR
jgi:hypothetical protein